MADIDYQQAQVLLFDPVHVNLRTTRYALHELGFRRIEAASTLKEFERLLKEGEWDLIAGESAAPGVDVFPYIRRIRRSELGSNPFVVIVLTSWIRDGGHVGRAIESGADDVVVRPFSTAFFGDRIRTLVRDRKAFIVTSDYVGPDRRSDPTRKSDAPSVKVPNTLQAIVEGDAETQARAQAWIAEARQTVEAERVRRIAMRVVISLELLIGTPSNPNGRFDYPDIIHAARELRLQLELSGRLEALQVAEALLEQVRAFKAPDERTAKNFKLAKELALGAYAAYANGSSIERSQDEIKRTVSALRKRLLTKTEPGGGALPAHALNTAAM